MNISNNDNRNKDDKLPHVIYIDEISTGGLKINGFILKHFQGFWNWRLVFSPDQIAGLLKLSVPNMIENLRYHNPNSLFKNHSVKAIMYGGNGNGDGDGDNDNSKTIDIYWDLALATRAFSGAYDHPGYQLIRECVIWGDLQKTAAAALRVKSNQKLKRARKVKG
jgi:hypothetical protein